MTDSFDRRTPRPASPLYSLRFASTRASGADPSARGVFFGPFPLTARLNPPGGAPRGLFTSMPGTGDTRRDDDDRREATGAASMDRGVRLR